MKNKILVYGAMGYMGKVFTEYARKEKLSLVLAARNEEVKQFAEKNDCEYRIFAATDSNEIAKYLADIKLVINLAGPFILTNQTFIKACIQTQTHYIDIAGEYPEFESAFGFHKQAEQTGIMIMAGAGFGVVPTDIAAVLAKNQLPDADKLVIAFATEGGVSQGTLKTVLKDINKSGVLLKNGKFIEAKPAFQSIKLKTKSNKEYNLVYNPWRADLFTALHSTGIENIETYSAFPSIIVSFMQGKMLWLRNFLLNNIVKLLPLGPNKKELQAGKTFVWATVSNRQGKEVTVSIEGPEAYLFTVKTLINITKNIMNNKFKAGFQTPSYYGVALIKDIEKVVIA